MKYGPTGHYGAHATAMTGVYTGENLNINANPLNFNLNSDEKQEYYDKGYKASVEFFNNIETLYKSDKINQINDICIDCATQTTIEYTDASSNTIQYHQ